MFEGDFKIEKSDEKDFSVEQILKDDKLYLKDSKINSDINYAITSETQKNNQIDEKNHMKNQNMTLQKPIITNKKKEIIDEEKIKNDVKKKNKL